MPPRAPYDAAEVEASVVDLLVHALAVEMRA
jgi:hypothetical protein